MPKIAYVKKKFRGSSLELIKKANAIIAEYAAQGFSLTLRQLYYQFVARDYIQNKQTEYKRLGDVINDARLAGMIDWLAIVDRTRYLRELSHWNRPADIVRACGDQFRVDRWSNQSYRPEIWIEKDALVGVIERVCNEFDVPYFSCRGYTSQSEMWVAAERLKMHALVNNQTPVIFHFGDHDPSGIDMTRDITDRLNMFMGGIELKRLALNMDQVQEYKPPPNFAKITDSRANAYIAEFGTESWELDALSPTALADLIRGEIESLIDDDKWATTERRQMKGRETLSEIATNYESVVRFLDA
jgi:hypothetical protein